MNGFRTLIIGVVSQKGGVGKSTLARLIAREYAQAGWHVKIADLDIQQGTAFSWQARRLQNALEPTVAVERFGTVAQAMQAAGAYDLMVLDGAPHASMGTRQIAKASDLVLLPTGLALDDLEPSVLLAHELRKAGIAASRVAFVLSRVGDSDAELDEARAYIDQGGYHCLKTTLPEKTAYRRASDEGRALTETRFASLKARADALVQEVVDLVETNNNREAA